jgi:2-polyprenyl-3-methyl-5-hydroxy-6-metoxy-1,4-benzoquinol methylase
MLETILQTYRSNSYDFRSGACTDDPLSELFDEWVDYYRMKWAIAKAIQPDSILEIGVRFGYSARAFLDASPSAKFVGIDADLPTFGGHVGAIEQAKTTLSGFDATILKLNSQALSRFPGEFYDLIHVDGQQDSDGTFHDLDIAVRQARYILLDEHLWSRDNFQAANEWLWLNKTAIEWALLIPGYAGELLIKTVFDQAHGQALEPNNSLSLAKHYSGEYYLQDCGFTQWRRTKGKLLSDSRLQTVADVAVAAGTPARVADLGAGRGELTYFFAQQGAKVTSIDYSSDAIGLVEKTFEGSEDNFKRVKLVCDSVLNPEIYEDAYDLAVASDLIEHLSDDEDETLYGLISGLLKPKEGTFVVHTAPNFWLYKYQHPRQQKAAKQVGCWLPRIRRTWYEKLMHINEQSPRVLKKQLARHFPHVLIWFADAEHLGGSLLRRYSIAEMRNATSLFAIASHRPIDRQAIIALFRLQPLTQTQAQQISLKVLKAPRQVEPGALFVIEAALDNCSDVSLNSHGEHPLHLSYHWESLQAESVVYDGLRSALTPSAMPRRQTQYSVQVRAPSEMGRFVLRVLPVQEGVRWHEDANPQRLDILITDKAGK